jgi:16S rRNA (cytidine1402-2'-O)-methyltransferase
MGTLYLIATPIGNLEDISARALRLLAGVSLIAAEDTRTARRLLNHFNIRAHLVSYNDHNRRVRIPQIISEIEKGDVALISEAGTPAISDPGQELVSAAIDADIPVVAVPGASAVLVGLTVSGLSTRQFVYLGFLPRQPGYRRRLLRDNAAERRTIVCFEAPSRLKATLADIETCFGDRRVAVCRELTKLHEEVTRGLVSDLAQEIAEPRGEYTLVIEGAPEPEPGALDAVALHRIEELRTAGLSAREATLSLTKELNLPRRQIYDAWVQLSRAEGSKTPLC